MSVIKIKELESRVKDKNQKGFTLIELIIALAIVAIVFGAIIGSSSAIQRQAKDAQRKSDLSKIQTALQQFYADHSYYPAACGTALCGSSIKSVDGTKTYLNSIPTDPTGVAYFYQPQVSISTTTVCSTNPNTCQYYYLCAKLDGTTTGTCAASGTYNYQINPF